MEDKISLIYSDEYFLCINKPSGMLVHSAKYMKKHSGLTLVDVLLKDFPEIKEVGDDSEYRPGIVHRLDKETSGIMIVAITQKAFLYFKSLFSNREIKKTYKAIVYGEIKEKNWTVDRKIGIKDGTIKRTVFSDKFAKDAITDFSRDKVFEVNGEKYTLVTAMPKTGRTHQIRVHLNSLNHPIIGDPLYGGKTNRDRAPRLMLHAFSIEFININGQKMNLEASLPNDFKNFISI